MDNIPRGIALDPDIDCLLRHPGLAGENHDADPAVAADRLGTVRVFRDPAALPHLPAAADARPCGPNASICRWPARVLLVSLTCTFFIAISHIPLADAVAIGFAAPLHHQHARHTGAGARRSAFAAGRRLPLVSQGVMIVLRPGFEERHWAYFLPALGRPAGMATYNVLDAPGQSL